MSILQHRGTPIIVVLGVVLTATSVSISALQAQDPPSSTEGSWSIGGSIGLIRYDGETEPRLFVVGLQAAQLRTGKLGADLSVGTMPRVLFDGIMPVGARAGVVLPIGISESTAVLPSAGLSFVSAFGSGGGAAELGANLGFGLLVGGGETTGLRLTATSHYFSELRSMVWLFEVGFASQRRRK